MANREKSSEAMLYFGDVIQMEYLLGGDEMHWSLPGVVIGVEGASVKMAQIIEDGEKTYLTTFGTAYGTPRHVEGAKRWTPLEIATAVTDGLWEYPVDSEWVAERAEYDLAVNSLLHALMERSKQSPWRYPLD